MRAKPLFCVFFCLLFIDPVTSQRVLGALLGGVLGHQVRKQTNKQTNEFFFNIRNKIKYNNISNNQMQYNWTMQAYLTVGLV